MHDGYHDCRVNPRIDKWFLICLKFIGIFHVYILAIKVVAEVGTIDVLINNAGIAALAPAIEVDLALARRVHEVRIFIMQSNRSMQWLAIQRKYAWLLLKSTT